MAITKEYNEIIKAAKAGGKITKKYFGKVLEIEGKSVPADFRTKADLESEKAIIKILSWFSLPNILTFLINSLYASKSNFLIMVFNSA